MNNRIECYAHELQTACEAGLTLTGAEENNPVWLGTTAQFDKWEKLKTNIEICQETKQNQR